jgi:hypothetical protein
MQQQTAHLAGDERVKFFTGRLWGHLFGRTSGRRRPTAGHRAGRADGAPAEKRGGAVRGLAPFRTPILGVAAALATGLWGNSQRAEAAISEGFETGMPTSYSTGNYVLGSGTWYFTNVIRGTTRHTGSFSCQIRNSTGALAITPTLSNGVGTITFCCPQPISIAHSTDDGGIMP